ncbi:hypothetical protein Ddye_019548 [Dipteronia dyeriana]|uniref:Gnk2-homologous domain-containing protein n=1 Tax=Dipteronia dyeriana TaxID=168575 RepID=A0AAD9TYN4_9ROSI|nr:hypothetical protein Ddye_019548 [Dipteronia dyeriana]
MASSQLIFFLCSILLHFVALTIAQQQILRSICSNDKGNFSANSTYQANLNHVLSSLSSTTQIDNGFFNASYGENQDAVNGMILCRGDVTPDSCKSCIKNSTQEIIKRCPNQKESFIWYDDCMLRYSYRYFFSNMEFGPYFWMYNLNNVTDVKQFSEELGDLLDDLKDEAASGGSLRKFATGNATVTNSQSIYALAQCTPDLSEKQCSDCLTKATNLLPTCCQGRQGGRVISPSCNFRYEIDHFYSNTTVNSPSPTPTPTSTTPSQPSPKPQSPTTSQQGLVSPPPPATNTATQKDTVETETVESLQFDFSTIKVATNDFSNNNKLDKEDLVPFTRLRIIHCDLKASNILIDQDMYPKFSDFGMARLFERDQTQADTGRVVETISKVCFTWDFFRQVGCFSSGMLVLKIISGQKNSSFHNGEETRDLPTFAWESWRVWTALNAIDPILRISSSSEMMRCIHIGLLCVQENVANQPTMASVVLMLNSYSISLPLPTKPAFFMHTTTEMDNPESTMSNQSKSRSVEYSINEVSITELDPR